MKQALSILLVFMSFSVSAQGLNAVVQDSEGESLEGVAVMTKGQLVFSGGSGEFKIESGSGERVRLQLALLGYNSVDTVVVARDGMEFIMSKVMVDLKSAKVESEGGEGVEWMNSIESGAIYKGVKSSVIRVDRDLLVAGEVQARAIFSKIPGVNMWESDAAGLQIGIGVRGLSPNRSSHLSVRQNGSPIAADPLGYPESYYTPPIESLQKVEYISGAGALQYGSQLGGMLNFKTKRGRFNTKPKARAILSGTTYMPVDGEYNTHGNVFADFSAGSINKSHYVCLDHKEGEGWRENTGFQSTTVIAALTQKSKNEQFTFSEDFTVMRRLERQPGGLTDAQFVSNPRSSHRERNWFMVDWNVAKLGVLYKPEGNWQYNASVFALEAQRQALGYLGSPNRVDYGDKRDLIRAEFLSSGFDARATRVWSDGDKCDYNAIVFGLQGYTGQTQMYQGLASDGDNADFAFNNLNALEGSHYTLPNRQISGFAQAIVCLTSQLSITPGIRCEWIDTRAEGWFRETIKDGAGNVIEDSVFTTERSRARGVLLPGVGFSLKRSNSAEVYGNLVSNYRAINFSDMQIKNLGIIVDPDIEDEMGSNIDLGYRKSREGFSFDVSAFMLQYRNRIGVVATTVPDPVLIEKPVLLRTNVADAVTVGLEGLVQKEVWSCGERSLGVLVSASVMSGRYEDGNEVENVPGCTVRMSGTYKSSATSAQVQWSYVGSQFTDATNSTYTPNAIYGEIPMYHVLDISARHMFSERVSLGVKVNNALNAMYFTRRATGYPGPGIIPSDGLNFRMSLVVKGL